MTDLDLSYAFCAKSRAGRAFIRTVENLTGRRKLMRSFRKFSVDDSADANIWKQILTQLGLELDLPGAGLANIPKDGPLVCVANHPFGILDGLVFASVLAEARQEFKFLANAWFAPAPQMTKHILPIEREATREALETNIATRRAALAELRAGGCVGVFPAGTVAAGRKIYQKRAFDANWKTFTATMINASKATVVPMFFEGQNSRAFQIASHLNPTLRLSLFINEFDNQLDKPVRLVIGEPIPYAALAPMRSDPAELMAYLRRRTYTLSTQFFDELTEGKPWLGPGQEKRIC